MTRSEIILEDAKKRFGYTKPFTINDFPIDGITNSQISKSLIGLKKDGAIIPFGTKSKGHAPAKYKCNKDYVHADKVTRSNQSKKSRENSKDKENAVHDVGLRIQNYLNQGMMA